VRQCSERKRVLVDVLSIAQQLFDEITRARVVQQVGEEVAAERVIPHVGHHGAAVGIGARFIDRIGIGVGKARLQHGNDDGIPGGIDQRFVREDGVGESRARQKQRGCDEERCDVPGAQSRGAIAPRGEKTPPSQP
jgi:hypothetical protein